TRATALERYTYYLRLLGLSPDPNSVPPTLTPDRRELAEKNFDHTYSALVDEYDRPVALQAYPQLQLAQGSSPSNYSGSSGQGQLYLNMNEDIELNVLLPAARDLSTAAQTINTIAGALTFLPDLSIQGEPWGLGVTTGVIGGQKLSQALKTAADALQIFISQMRDNASIAARMAGYQRRADEWMLQANLAARELMQIGRQIIASLIAEQIAYHDYKTVKSQVQQAQDVQSFLQT